MNIRKRLGLDYGDINILTTQEERIKYINFKLAALGLPIHEHTDQAFIDLFEDVIKDYQEKTRLVDLKEIGINKRIQKFFDDYFIEQNENLTVVDQYFTLDHYGLARELSLPPNANMFFNEYISSYRIKQGILNNPKNDRRTTAGSFHIVEGGLPIPQDKKSVPQNVFIKLYQAATNPPEDLMILPFTATQESSAKTFVSLMLKPTVSPEVRGYADEKVMEILFIVPGSMVSNLDFVESVFGNAGDSSTHLNDAGLDYDHWSGHTGYIILAPHLNKLTKKEVGLPNCDVATERQRKDGMCYIDDKELYNNGNPFKVTCRDKSGVTVTLIGDNYYGYSKKEIKTQISFAANLLGNVEEEHAGGTIAFPRRNVGEFYSARDEKWMSGYSFESVKEIFKDLMIIHDSNYGVDRKHKNIFYVPENIEVDLHKSEIKWMFDHKIRTLKLLPEHIYMLPNGERLHMEKHPEAPTWKLISTEAEGTFCHKPCTVSGGGKSEISKSIDNAIIYGTYYVGDLEHDLDEVEKILNYDYRHRWKDYPDRARASRPILSLDRTLGSVIKLLSPSPAYSDEFNSYLDGISNHIKALVFMVKRFYRQSWGEDWRSHFTVDIINGKPGNEINYDNRKIRPSYLRVGFDGSNAWRIFKLRMDFMPSEKIQMEDDVTASLLIPANQLSNHNPEYKNTAYKFVSNCEFRFFQRPDEVIVKGYDLQAELDLSSNNLFATNFEPLNKAAVQEIKDNAMAYIRYSNPVKVHVESFLESDFEYCILSSEPRLVNGKPSKNPRYLEHRKDFINPQTTYIAEIGTRFARRVPLHEPVPMPVNAILPGRRNNPPGMEKGVKIPPLSVYGPIHYQELPEFFMDLISSLTGKSPSTTGAGSEGALTKGPFNMLLPIYDLNNALLSYILSGYHAFTTPAGYIGPNIRVDHDISILVPELWSRLSVSERNPDNLIAEGSFEKVKDFEFNGKLVPASILGYRMTEIFCYKYLGKIFDEPQTIFEEKILRPEKQSLEAFVDGIENISNGHKKAALSYFEDGSIEDAIPPIKALLNIMAYGNYEGATLGNPEIRKLFEQTYVLESDWYLERLQRKQQLDVARLETIVENLKTFIDNPVNKPIINLFNYDHKLQEAMELRNKYASSTYLKSLIGMIGL